MEKKQIQLGVSNLNIKAPLLESILKLARAYPQIYKIVLFGSRARCEQNERSDIDLAIFAEGEEWFWCQFCSDMDDLDTLLKFDLVKISKNTDGKLKENIHREGIVLWEAQR